MNNINIYYGSNIRLINQVKPLFHTIHVAENFEAVKNIIDTNEGHLFTIIVDTVIDGGKAFPGGGPVNMAVYTLRLGGEAAYIRCLLSYVQGGYVL